MKWVTRHNAEPSQCITKFTTDDRQFHNDFKPFVCIMKERFDNTPKDQSNYYLREETKKECQEDTSENKADETLTSLRRDCQSKEDKQKITVELKPYIHWAIQ